MLSSISLQLFEKVETRAYKFTDALGKEWTKHLQ